MKELYIYGSGTIARETIRLVKKINIKKKIWKIKGLVDNYIKNRKKIDDIDLINEEKVINNLNTYAICAISEPFVKKKVISKIKKRKIKLTSLICPEVHIYPDTKIGKGSIILSNSQIGHTSIVGENILLSFGVDVGHNVNISNYCTILPNSNIGGYSKIGSCVLIGSGANVMPNINIGSNSLIGIGSTIMRNVNENTSVIVKQKNIILPRKIK